ncbi:sulfotransferase family protein [Phytohabitans flavus]|uniref:sulfotransferase family protein n=1 Tax=Phytohabitans flavus TaxID=1076124 RepID=UPI003636BBC4
MRASSRPIPRRGVHGSPHRAARALGAHRGLRRLVEEDRLNPVERATTAWAKRRWRRAHGVTPGQATPVYVVGLQRSGTNMLMRGLDAAPQFQVHNENDRRVFHRFQLRSDAVLSGAIRSSRHAYVIVKPLCETHRVDELLALPDLPAGRALWVWRDVDDRARSEVAKFGTSNLDALRAIAEGTIGAGWQGQRLDAESRALIGDFDYMAMSPHTAAALFWYIRNGLFFRLGLAGRDDVLLCSYDALVADPEAATRRLCAFLDLPYDPRLCAHVERRTPPAARSTSTPGYGHSATS